MGHSSKFSFPLPGRKHPAASAQLSQKPKVPLTKAQKILGTGEISIDSPALSVDSKWTWDTRSGSGISISISEATPSHTDGGNTGLGISHGDTAASSPRSPRPERRWEDESEIIPRGINHQTDASSLRRRQSSSTITSYYDKTKQPLSISQQTSNSAMAKGLPTKAQALLDMDGLAESQAKKKKPSRLDLSALIPRSKFSRHLKPDAHKGPVLGADMLTKSPSVMSDSPVTSPSPTQQKNIKKPKRKPTKESLRETSPLAESHTVPPIPQYSGTGRQHRATKSTVDLYNLYDHYEQRSFADVLEKDIYGTPSPGLESPLDRQTPPYQTPSPISSERAAYLSPFASNGIRAPYSSKQASPLGGPSELTLAGVLSPSSLISPHADSASISSRHTRTSKASKRTDRSLTDIDLQQNSMLTLSSDSEDDGYEPSSKSSLAVPPALSDGQASPTSPRSAISQRSATAPPQDYGRPKLPKRTSFATNPQFLPIPEGSAPSSPPKISARSSSLLSNSAAKKMPPSVSHQISRLSINTTSTSRTVSYGTMQSVSMHDAKAISMVPRTSPANQINWSSPSDKAPFDSFPSPPNNRANRPSIASNASEQPTPPLSPTSVDFYLQSQRTSVAASDRGSVRSGRSLGSTAKGGRRGSTASSAQDTNSGRFMAVTRQEELLLAALRMKRARMREDIIAEFEEDIDREDHQLERETTNESSVYSSGMSRQSSMSTMRNIETGAMSLSVRPHQQSQMRLSGGSTEKSRVGKGKGRGQILLMMDRPKDHAELDTAEPSPDLSDFMDFDDGSEGLDFPMPYSSRPADPGTGSRKSSTSSSTRSGSVSSSHGRTATQPPPPTVRVKARRHEDSGPRLDSDEISPRNTSRRDKNKRDMSQGIPEAPEEDEDDMAADVPRPDSPISPDAFPMPQSIARKKQVRLSAVGNYKPNVEAGWWDDSG
ncbi:hypothetical protein B0H63DRAFT_396829 [Podospora didyma]|uniref:Uncharacterized protein n=1 Tax=Podospora didyma TaxID=330526 RepID=A0AAE0TVH5_9PEZI|nr:hypothetical protein B0H63DRAFT_396829 [Podospora didyma]